MDKPITLEELLASRDNRHSMQMSLLKAHPDKTLVCLTVVMPGSIKRNELSLVVAHAAVEALRKSFSPEEGELTERDLETGYEAYLITSLAEMDAKERCCDIEDKHPLGRLFDIDVISHDGAPLPRAAVGRAPRKCLICDNEARYCMRNCTHTQEELHEHINRLVADYVVRNT